MQVAILSHHADFHALAIQREVEQSHDVKCHIVETDRLSGRVDFTWTNTSGAEATIPTTDGKAVLSEIDALWLRRINVRPRIPGTSGDPIDVDVITNDCRESLIGSILTSFRGTWISSLSATQRAENKLLQLTVAMAAGLRVPQTLVSQDPEQIRAFCAGVPGHVVVKPVKGSPRRTLVTTMVTDALLASETSLRLCPAIYQEYVPGNTHLRVCCFGDDVWTGGIRSEDLDWRINLAVPIGPYDLSKNTRDQVTEVLRLLDLRMGIFDFKVGVDGEPVWLEVNPQGQFLFLEGACGMPLTSAFAQFFVASASVARR